jgi:hypothetical protein
MQKYFKRICGFLPIWLELVYQIIHQHSDPKFIRIPAILNAQAMYQNFYQNIYQVNFEYP